MEFTQRLIPFAVLWASVSACQKPGSDSDAGASTGSHDATSTGGTETGTPATGGRDAVSAYSGGSSPGGAGSGAGPDHPWGMGGSTPEVCSFQLSASLSPKIPTVGVVNWSTDLSGVLEARIEYSLEEPQDHELNIDGGGPISPTASRALMLGLKPNRSYSYRIVGRSQDETCVSPERSLVTALDPDAPTLKMEQGTSFASRLPGYVVTCIYSGVRGSMVFDTDGDVVWWWDGAPQDCARARIDEKSEYLWTTAANPGGAGEGNGVHRVRMDGTGEEAVSGLLHSHHDFVLLPDGAAAFLLWTDADDASSDVVERSSDGTLRTIIRLDGTAYPTTVDKYHANALRYRAQDDTLTVSDLYVGTITKVTRTGHIDWQMRLDCEGSDPTRCFEVDMPGGNHGHHLLESGNLLVFYTNFGSPASVQEYGLVRSGDALSADLRWDYVSDKASMIFGDVQRLANENTLVTYSSEGYINEVTSQKELVYSVTSNSSLRFGYVNFRATLYADTL